MGLLRKLFGRMTRHNGIPFDMASPRMSYYNFTHRHLPELFFDDPERLIRFTISEGGEDLKRLWISVAEANPYPPTATLANEIQIASSAFSNRQIVWITTPRPQQPTESFYIALLGGEEGSGIDCHYLVLELREDGEGAFCEWTSEMNHLNYGPLQERTMAAFQEAVLSGLTP